MNQVLAPFLNKGAGINYFFIKKDGHKYEAFLQENFAPQNNCPLWVPMNEHRNPI
jgi:hypothetical protein